MCVNWNVILELETIVGQESLSLNELDQVNPWYLCPGRKYLISVTFIAA